MLYCSVFYLLFALCEAWTSSRPQNYNGLSLVKPWSRQRPQLIASARNALTAPGSSSSASSSPSSASFSNSSTGSSSHSNQQQQAHKAPPPPPPATDIDEEIKSGRLLEGGKVIDFSSVKASGPEEALRQARQKLLEGDRVLHSSSTILGIHQDVMEEVGHELGAFATAQEIQDCAAYLRSKAPPGLLEQKEVRKFSASDAARFDKILFKAYEESGEVTGAFAKTFYMGTMLLPMAARKAIWAIYVWCRRTDEIVDAPRDNDDDMLLDLSSWELRLENLWKYGQVQDVYDLCLLDARIKYPNMDITPFMDMIRGMLMDVPGLGQDRYDGFDELHLYCYRVAGTVGLMSLPIFGCAPGFDYETAR
jgi:phytoene synthase